MPTTRRKVLGTIAALTAVGVGSTQVFGEESVPIEIAKVEPEAEFVIFENTEMEDVDVSGYVVAFEYDNDGTDQRRTLPEDTVIGGGQSLIVATGAKEVPEANVKLDYDGDVLNNDDTDVVALLSPEGSVVVRSDDSSEDEEDGDENETGGEDETTPPTEGEPDDSDDDSDESSDGSSEEESEEDC